MKKTSYRSGLAALVLAWLALAAQAASAAPDVTAQLEATYLPLGRETRLSVEVSGVSSAPMPSIPSIPGLEVRSLGQTTSMEFLGGSMSY